MGDIDLLITANGQQAQATILNIENAVINLNKSASNAAGPVGGNSGMNGLDSSFNRLALRAGFVAAGFGHARQALALITLAGSPLVAVLAAAGYGLYELYEALEKIKGDDAKREMEKTEVAARAAAAGWDAYFEALVNGKTKAEAHAARAAADARSNMEQAKKQRDEDLQKSLDDDKKTQEALDAAVEHFTENSVILAKLQAAGEGASAQAKILAEQIKRESETITTNTQHLKNNAAAREHASGAMADQAAKERAAAREQERIDLNEKIRQESQIASIKALTDAKMFATDQEKDLYVEIASLKEADKENDERLALAVKQRNDREVGELTEKRRLLQEELTFKEALLQIEELQHELAEDTRPGTSPNDPYGFRSQGLAVDFPKKVDPLVDANQQATEEMAAQWDAFGKSVENTLSQTLGQQVFGAYVNALEQLAGSHDKAGALSAKAMKAMANSVMRSLGEQAAAQGMFDEIKALEQLAVYFASHGTDGAALAASQTYAEAGAAMFGLAAAFGAGAAATGGVGSAGSIGGGGGGGSLGPNGSSGPGVTIQVTVIGTLDDRDAANLHNQLAAAAKNQSLN